MCNYFIYTVGEIIICSPAEFVNLLTCKHMVFFNGSFILMARNEKSTKHLEKT